MKREKWLQETPKKCMKFLKSTLPEDKLSSLPDYDRIKDITYDELYDELIEADPQQGKNCIWLFLQFKRGQFLLEDVERVRDDLNLFFANNTKIDRKFRRLGSIDYQKLKELIQPFEKHAEVKFVSIPNEDYIILYDGPYGQLYQVLTQEGSCSLGSGTKWCTAADKNNMFDRYNRDGPLFIWYDNDKKMKYQFHFESESYMDERDNEIEPNLLTYFVLDHPVLKNFFLKKLTESMDHNKRMIIPLINRSWREAEEYIMQYPKYAYEYARNFLKSRWLKAEPYIMQDPKYAYEYALNILKSDWPTAEPYIMQDPRYAYLYAKNILRRDWQEAKKYIMKNPQFAYEYAKYVLGRRWLEAEDYIIKDPQYAYKYTRDFFRSRDILKSRWRDAEPYIMRDPQYAYLYARDILESRWSDAEPYIMQDPQSAYSYTRDIL